MKVRKVVCLLFAVLIFAVTNGNARADHKPSDNPILFGLTAVVVRENLRFLDRWSHYLSNKMDRPVKFVRRRSYREVMDLLESGALDFAWICGFPFVQKRDPEFLELMTVPIYVGKPLYHSYIIVHKDSPYLTIKDLKNRIFALSDPESNSGFLYPQFLLAKNKFKMEDFFRQSFFTYNHAETVQAVAEQFADGGAVDSYIWEYMKAHNPKIADKTRIIKKSPTFGFPPLVSRRGIDKKLVKHMKSVLLAMANDPGGRSFLDGLELDGFGDSPPSLFNGIKQMANDTRRALLWLSLAEEKTRK